MKANSDQRSLRSSKPNLVNVLELLHVGILDCKSQFDIVDYSLGIIPLKFFALKRVVSLLFLSHHFLCYLLFRCVC